MASSELHASADKDGSIAALREQRAIESTMARWAARMTTLARLMRTLTDDDVESHSRSDNKVRAQNILHASNAFLAGRAVTRWGHSSHWRTTTWTRCSQI